MKMMLDQKRDMAYHMADFKRLAKEIDLAIEETKKDLAGVEREKAKCHAIHKNKFMQHCLRKGIVTKLTQTASKVQATA